ncbi:MAG TPA: EthD domain-containing protein [Variovorax sp.]|nr:EthD domain-containing protein [Variovorax sp.]
MTLLARKEGLSTADFRNYWAGPHAALALGMDGISKYTHNRVDKVLWASGGKPVFDVDGIVELFFSDAEAMRQAQACAVGTKFIPADEPNFLKGWSLCVVETDGEEPCEGGVKVIVPFHASAQAREGLWDGLCRVGAEMRAKVALNWTVSTAGRERLWTEPNPPSGFMCIWLESVAKAHASFEPSSELLRFIETHVSEAAAYLIDELRIR